MDQVSLMYALKELVEDNKAALVSGFVHQGASRKIEKVSLSPLDPPASFYHIVINVEFAESVREPGLRTRRESIRRNTYGCEIHIVDVALPQPGESVAYERMTIDFRTLTDRLEGLVRNTACFQADAPYNTTKYKLVDSSGDGRLVNIRNEDQAWYDAQENLVASWLYSMMSFQVEELVVP